MWEIVCEGYRGGLGICRLLFIVVRSKRGICIMLLLMIDDE